jgi:peptidoglycan endopeptidase LytE
VTRGWRVQLKRYGAPAAFLAAVTIAVLLVRSGLETSSPSSTRTVATTQPATTAATTRRRPLYYRLHAGQTISDVAIRFDTTVTRLLALNPRIEPTQLTVGQRIRVR